MRRSGVKGISLSDPPKAAQTALTTAGASSCSAPVRTPLTRPASTTSEVTGRPQRSVLDHLPRFAAQPDATMTLTKATLERVQLGEVTLEDAIEAGDVKVDGREEAIGELFGMLDTFDFWFNIVTP